MFLLLFSLVAQRAKGEALQGFAHASALHTKPFGLALSIPKAFLTFLP
ncbi:MAG: hypothetical protein NZ551_06800 [Microscillaceae bacterium]|nr:hypothetical protein [Microscillaceae bacterium]MDW8460902.1 hypothetical protein [Cytophagales bacterium]